MKIPILLVLVAVGFSHAAEKRSAAGELNKGAIQTKAQEEEAKVEKFEREVKEASRLAQVLNADKRKPSKEDVSGVWSAGPNLVGETFQLEQTGKSITGRGYHWGCLGVYSVFSIRGVREKEGLTLTFSEPNGDKYTYRLAHTEKDGYPRYDSTEKEERMHMETWFETKERDAELQKQAGAAQDQR